MVRNILNQNSQTTSVVITNRMNATLPLEQTQADFTAPILIGMKGLNGFGGAGKLVKVNSTNDGLEYGDDDGSNWTYSNPNLFIKTGSTATNLLIGTSTNSTNPATLALYKFISKGTSLFDGFTVVYDDTTATNNRLNIGTDTVPSGNANTHGMLYIKTDNSFTARAILIESAAAQTDVYFVFRGGYTGGQDATIRWNGATGTGTLNFLQFTGADRYTFDNDIYFQSSHTFNLGGGNISNGSWNGTTINTSQGGTGLTSFTSGDLLYYTGGTTFTKLAIGTQGQILKVASNNAPEWANETAPDLSTSTNFGTGASGAVSVGNKAGTGASVDLNLYGASIQLYNTSNVNVATFTPVNNTCNLTLNGGEISGATWNGNTIGVAKGGTGLTSYSTGDILYATGSTSIAKLGIGGSNQVLGVNNGLPQWKNIDTTTVTQFGTASTSHIEIGNTAGGSINVNMYGFYFQFFNTSNTAVAQFTPYSNRMNISLGSSNAQGVISNADWQGNIISSSYGGTGHNTYSHGDMLYKGGGSNLAKLNIGTFGQVLTSNGTTPVWANPTSSGTISTTTVSITSTGKTSLHANSGNQQIVMENSTNNNNLRVFAPSGNTYLFFYQANNNAYWDTAYGQSAINVYWNFRNASASYATGYLTVTSGGTPQSNFSYTSSDDRLKINEELIENATDTIMKLRPQKYDKYTYLQSEMDNPQNKEDEKKVNKTTHEWGFIAQEVYYEVPELRKIVDVPPSATLIDNHENMDFKDIRNDPDYSNWGEEKASLHYNSFIALLTKGFQEQQEEIKTLKSQVAQLMSALNVSV